MTEAVGTALILICRFALVCYTGVRLGHPRPPARPPLHVGSSGHDEDTLERSLIRVDLHLHSRASTKTGNWFLQSASLPESYTAPEDAYQAAKRRGMSFVTLTDHDTIDGALEIAHHPDAFVSVEATTWFPEDGTPLHVLCWDIDEADFAEIDRARASVHDLVGVLRSRQITHALAHPLQRIGARLTADHLERCLLLFPVWEGRNGARSRVGNETAIRIAQAATPEYLAKLANMHDLAPAGSGVPSLTAGSDDHGLIDAAATWTETPDSHDVGTLLAHITAGRTTLAGAHGSTAALSHAMMGLAIKAATDRGHCPVPADLRTMASEVMQHPFPMAEGIPQRGRRSLARDSALRADWQRLDDIEEGARRSHARYRVATDWAQREILRRAMAGDNSRPGLAGITDRIALMLGATALAAPYMAAAGYHASEARHARGIAHDFFGNPDAGEPQATTVVFTDTFDDLNGVAGMMRRLADRTDALGLDTTVVAFGDSPVDTPGLIRIRPLARLPMPAYRDGEMTLGIPSIAEVLDTLERRDARVVHAATLGPLGLAGILAARILGIPFITSHSTQLARYTLALTGDRLAAEAVRAGSAWVHRQADRILVPSLHMADGLAEEGLPVERVRTVGRGVDTTQFNPERRGFFAHRRLGSDGVTVLAVSRLSQEKGLDFLLDAADLLEQDGVDLRVALVGDGPHRDALAARVAGTRHRLLGPFTGDRLAALYASADIFCLPSVTETFGQVVLEAQASGLPVVVPMGTAIAEQVTDGVTGTLSISDGPRHLAMALRPLLLDRDLRISMGRRAREAMVSHATWDDVFVRLANEYRDVARGRELRTETPRRPVEMGVL